MVKYVELIKNSFNCLSVPICVLLNKKLTNEAKIVCGVLNTFDIHYTDEIYEICNKRYDISMEKVKRGLEELISVGYVVE